MAMAGMPTMRRISASGSRDCIRAPIYPPMMPPMPSAMPVIQVGSERPDPR
jgi:hypothetical protein